MTYKKKHPFNLFSPAFTLLFILCMVLSSIFASYFISESLFKKMHNKVLHTSLRHKICELLPVCSGTDSAIVVCGDSRAQRQIDMTIVNAMLHKPSINIATESGDLAICQSIFHEFPQVLNAGKNLIVISVSPFQANDGALRAGYLSNEAFIDMTFRERVYLYRHDMLGLCNMYSNILGQYRKFSRVQGPECCGRHKGTFDKTNGFLPIDDVWDGTIGASYALPGAPWYLHANISGERWNQMTRIAKSLEKFPNKFVIYSPPVSQSYKNYLRHTDGFAMDSLFSVQMRSMTAQISNLRYFDFFLDTTIIIPDSFYYDPAHLNIKGAAVFTKILFERLVSN